MKFWFNAIVALFILTALPFFFGLAVVTLFRNIPEVSMASSLIFLCIIALWRALRGGGKDG